jgi:hypothetical protein
MNLVQLANLERKVVRGGKSSIDHARGLHDDLGNSAAGALVYASSASNVAPEFIWTSIPLSGGTAAYRERAEREGSYAPDGMVVDHRGGVRPDRLHFSGHMSADHIWPKMGRKHE